MHHRFISLIRVPCFHPFCFWGYPIASAQGHTNSFTTAGYGIRGRTISYQPWPEQAAFNVILENEKGPPGSTVVSSSGGYYFRTSIYNNPGIKQISRAVFLGMFCKFCLCLSI